MEGEFDGFEDTLALMPDELDEKPLQLWKTSDMKAQKENATQIRIIKNELDIVRDAELHSMVGLPNLKMIVLEPLAHMLTMAQIFRDRCSFSSPDTS